MEYLGNDVTTASELPVVSLVRGNVTPRGLVATSGSPFHANCSGVTAIMWVTAINLIIPQKNIAVTLVLPVVDPVSEAASYVTAYRRTYVTWGGRRENTDT